MLMLACVVVIVCRARMVAPVARKGVAPFLPDDVPEDLPSKSITLKSGITISSGRYQALKCNFSGQSFPRPLSNLWQEQQADMLENTLKIIILDTKSTKGHGLQERFEACSFSLCHDFTCKPKMNDILTFKNAQMLSFDLHSFCIQCCLIGKCPSGLDAFPEANCIIL